MLKVDNIHNSRATRVNDLDSWVERGASVMRVYWPEKRRECPEEHPSALHHFPLPEALRVYMLRKLLGLLQGSPTARSASFQTPRRFVGAPPSCLAGVLIVRRDVRTECQTQMRYTYFQMKFFPFIVNICILNSR